MGNYNQEETDDVLWDILLYIKDSHQFSVKLVTWEKYDQEAQILVEIPVIDNEMIVGWGYVKILVADLLEASAHMTRKNLYKGIDNTLRPYKKWFGNEK